MRLRPAAPDGDALVRHVWHAGDAADLALAKGGAVDFEAAAEIEDGAVVRPLEVAAGPVRGDSHERIELSGTAHEFGAG